MEIGAGGAANLGGLESSLAALRRLALEDAALATGAGVAAAAAAAAEVDVLQRRYELRLERLEVVARLEAQLAALKARDVAECLGLQQAMTPPDATVHERTFAEMSAVEEIAGVLTVSSAAVGALVEVSRRVCSLALVFGALSAGDMSWQHAKVLADEIEGLDPVGAAGLVEHFFDPGAPSPARGAAPGELVPSRFRAKVRAWRERHHPDSIEKRHVKGVGDRRMDYAPDRDGMAWLSLYLPGDTACAIWNRTTATARGLQAPTEERTLTQLRADIAASLLLGAGLQPSTNRTGAAAGTERGNQPATSSAAGKGRTEGAGTTAAAEPASDTDPVHAPGIGKVPVPRADVLVTVPVFSLLGLTDEPATLDGFGPVPASMARKLVADGAESFYRVLVDPRDGAPLEIGRKNYRLTETIKKWIRMRDAKCTFPGCNNHTPDNDTDHLTAWQHGGTTGVPNLAQLCPKHHRLKHHSQWTPNPATTNEPPGWTSPTGRHYQPEQPDPEPTHWPPGTPPASTAAMPVDIGPRYVESAAPPTLSTLQELTHGLAGKQLEAWQFQQIIAGMPSWPDPPPEEPPGDDMLDPDELSPDDPLWDDLRAGLFVLPPDPQKDAALLT